MQRLWLNYVVDLLTLLALLAIAGTGLIMRFALPPGSGHVGNVLWGLGRHDWGSVHFWLTVGTAGILVLHVILHWSWVCTVSNRLLHPRRRVAPPSPSARRAAGVVFLALIAGVVVGFTYLAKSSVRSTGIEEQDAEPTGGGRARAGRGAGGLPD